MLTERAGVSSHGGAFKNTPNRPEIADGFFQPSCPAIAFGDGGWNFFPPFFQGQENPQFPGIGSAFSLEQPIPWFRAEFSGQQIRS